MGTKPDYKKIFIDSSIYEAYVNFESFYCTSEGRFPNTSEYTNLRQLRIVLRSILVEELSWSLICSIAKDISYDFNDKLKMLRMTIMFCLYVSELNLIDIKEKNLFVANKDCINDFLSHVAIRYTDLLNENLTSPSSIFSWHFQNEYVVGLIETKNEFLLSIFKQFLNDTPLQDQFKIKRGILVFSYFEQAISPLTVNRLEDFNDVVFFKCLKNVDRHFGEKNRHFITARVVNFFQWLLTVMPEEIRIKNFVLVDSVLLTYINLIGKIMDNYKVVKYSPYDNVKYLEKMILIPSSDESHDKGESYRVYPFDASFINNMTLKNWYIEYFWKCENITLKSRSKSFTPLMVFLEEYDKTIDENQKEITFTESDISKYVSVCKNKNNGDSNTAFMISQMKKFLEFLELENHMKVKPILYRMLVYKDSQSDANKEAYTSTEIKKIINYLKKEKPLHSLAVAIIANSELRKDSVLNLKIDCLEKTLTRADGEEYVVKVHTKRSDNTLEFININRYVKSYIDECIEYTREIRKSMNSYDKDYIFIHLQQSRIIPRRFKSDSLATEINKACTYLNIKPNGTKGIRNNYMQAVSNYVSENKLNPAIISSLSGHTLQRHSKNYDQVDIIQFCEQNYGVNIGNVRIRGEVKKDAIYPKENIVVGNCGFCNDEHCTLNGNLDCFMCKSFVTTLSCIPFFEKEIEKLDVRIISEKISHEKDFLLSKKKLLVGYLSQLMILKGETA